MQVKVKKGKIHSLYTPFGKFGRDFRSGHRRSWFAFYRVIQVYGVESLSGISFWKSGKGESGDKLKKGCV